MLEWHVPLHKNDKALVIGDMIWIVWCTYGLFTGVPLAWGLISLFGGLTSTFLILWKYKDAEWKERIIS